jgi:hypothetical protein
VAGLAAQGSDDRLVLVAGVFHFNGLLPHVIDPNNDPPEFLARLYAEVSPDGAGHSQVVVDKLAGCTSTNRRSRLKISRRG